VALQNPSLVVLERKAGLQGWDVPTEKKVPPKQSQNLPATSQQKLASSKT
jgi:hypothetical protein